VPLKNYLNACTFNVYEISASCLHRALILWTFGILFAFKRDATRCPVSEGESEPREITKGVGCIGDELIEWLANRNGILFELVKKILAEIAGGNGAISAKTGNQRESVWQQNWTTLPAPRQQSRTRQIEALFTVHTLCHMYTGAYNTENVRIRRGRRTKSGNS